MKLAGSVIAAELREKLKSATGRHLYGVLGTYKQLKTFEKKVLSQGKTASGDKFPTPVNLNKALLDRFDDESLKKLTEDEARMPLSVRNRLNNEFDDFLAYQLEKKDVLTLKNIEILFAYEVDPACLRRRATNQKHIILLLPGKLLNDRIVLFLEGSPVNHRNFPGSLVTREHLWEIEDDK